MSTDQNITTDRVTDALGVIATHLEYAEADLADMLADLRQAPAWSATVPELETLLAEIRSDAERVAQMIRDNRL